MRGVVSALTAAQMAIVGAPATLPEDVAMPEIRYEIHDLGDLPDYDFSRHPYQPRPADGEAPSVAGYCAVLRRNGKWFARREFEGGASGSIAYATRDEAVAEIESAVSAAARFWMEKVGWKLSGDKAPNHDRWGTRTDQVIR